MDFLLVSPTLRDRLRRAEVDREYRGRESRATTRPWIVLRDAAAPP